MASSIVGIMRDYPGFEPDAFDSLIGEDSGTFSAVSSQSRLDPTSQQVRPSLESQRRLIGRPDDQETVWPDNHFYPTTADRDPADPAGTITRRGVNLEQAATIYLRSQQPGGGEGWGSTSQCSEQEPSNRLFHDLHQASPRTAERVARGLTSMPEPGDDFLGFRIVEELGRGAFGRVFLALQGELADRLVALKVSAELAEESQTLAQLQHTNIVPIFSAHHSPPFHAVCMPYFGRTTLADLLDDVEHQETLPDSGKAFLKTIGLRQSSLRPGSARNSRLAALSCDRQKELARTSDPGPMTSPGSSVPEVQTELFSETMRKIGTFTYVDAVLWMGSRIAAGLEHAHGQGILHRDLKPANVLITDDGQPMILDFNLAEDTKAEVGASAASAGGTLRYMSPEHLSRFLGRDIEVDARSDIFALGVMFFELLTGRPPFEVYSGHSILVLQKMVQDRSKAPPPVRCHNPAISPAVESIVRHCLEPETERRYRSAAELHEDLERHLAHLPLKYAPEPSIAERSRKWIKRHPRLGSSTTVAVVAVFLLAILAGTLVVRGNRLSRLEASRDLARFQQGVSSVRFLLSHRTWNQASRTEGQALAVELLNRYHILDDPEWTNRSAVTELTQENGKKLREEVAEVLLMLTQAKAIDAAERTEVNERRKLARTAQKWNQLAMATFPTSRESQAFWVQQAVLTRLLGQEAEGDRLAAEAEKLPLRTARDNYLAAAGLASRGEHTKAIARAEEAIRLDPQHFWAYFILGICHDHLEHHAEAMACFTTCIALRPDFAESWLYRGFAYAKRRDMDRARADFDRASQLRPTWYEPYLNRSLVYREQGDHVKAENDLTRALDLGAPETRIYFLRSAERRVLGDRRGADLDQMAGLKKEPSDVPSWISRGIARMTTNPELALEDFRNALKLDPRSLEALQMSAYLLSNIPGRDEETIRMLDRAVELHPGVVAFRSGRGVQLAILGRREEAIRDARESLWRDTNPAILYQVAGIYATTSKTHPEDRLEAYRLLSTALRAGFGFDMVDEDHELDPIRNEPEFVTMVDAARLQAKERMRRPAGR